MSVHVFVLLVPWEFAFLGSSYEKELLPHLNHKMAETWVDMFQRVGQRQITACSNLAGRIIPCSTVFLPFILEAQSALS